MEIMFEDLTIEAQKRLLKEAGVSAPEDMDWDTIPVAVVEFREEDHLSDEDDFADDIYDYDEDETLF